jgi:hypothetical protein
MTGYVFLLFRVGRLEFEGGRVDAIALTCCFSRTILEEMTKMCAAVFAHNFGSGHEERPVLV